MTNYKKLQITYSDPCDLKNDLTVSYRLRPTPITQKWIERVIAAQNFGYQIDDPSRFYGFNPIDQQISNALDHINRLIVTLNKWIKIDYFLNSISDQDTLNRLHHIFEIEHGLLDAKQTDPILKQHLCDLNLSVHRCESIARGAHPRHVVTYFGLPKNKTLSKEDYKYFEPKTNFGTVYINYVEIGKTLHDLMLDNDIYIDLNAFQPFKHYSADFVVKFWNDDSDITHHLQSYYYSKEDFFKTVGYSWADLSQSIGSIPVADLDHEGDILKMLAARQFVKAVHFL